MRRPASDPDQTTLPIDCELFGQPARPIEYRARQICSRREHPGAPMVGIDYGFDFGAASESDPQGPGIDSCETIPVVHFDFEEVYRHLDGDCAEEAREAILKLAAEALAAMSEWLQEEFVSPSSDIRWRLDTSTRCKLALLTLYANPAALGNPTLEQLANRLGISKQRLAILWGEFKRRFPGVKAAWEKSETAKAAYRAAHEGDT